MVVAIGVGGGGAGYATCKGMPKYGTDRSKARWNRGTEKSLHLKKNRQKR